MNKSMFGSEPNDFSGSWNGRTDSHSAQSVYFDLLHAMLWAEPKSARTSPWLVILYFFSGTIDAVCNWSQDAK